MQSQVWNREILTSLTKMLSSQLTNMQIGFMVTFLILRNVC